MAQTQKKLIMTTTTTLKLRRNAQGYSSTYHINPEGYYGKWIGGQEFSSTNAVQMAALKEIVENNSFDTDSADALEVLRNY